MELGAVWMASIRKRVQRRPAVGGGREPRSIFRVPRNIRSLQPSAYDPMIISFGPYHLDRPHLKDMEEEKWRYLRSLLSFQQGRSVEDFVTKMRELVQRVQSCYAESVDEISTPRFVEMMLLDGCFLVEFIIKYRCGHLRDPQPQQEEEGVPMSVSSWRFWFVVNDMMLLENQLPFFLLQEIWNLLADRRVQNGDRLDVYFLHFLKDYSPTNSTSVESELPIHLCNPYHLLHLFHSYILPPTKPRPGRWSPQDRIPCATELMAAGVKFREKEDTHVLEVKFDGGVMKMAHLKIYDHTESYLRNLIAFEQCFPAVGNEVSTYAVLMDFLIDTPEDAAVLRRSGILLSGVGSDDNVARFFSNLCRDAYSYRTGDLYTELREYGQVSPWRRRADLVRSYLRNWMYLLFLVGAFVLAFVITSTARTVGDPLNPSTH